ncbi:MAG TPA: KamA family radical SAM protein [Bacteroidales bacterium]|nr:KamA family radical SAM protein [Bacteroidales bacterium]
MEKIIETAFCTTENECIGDEEPPSAGLPLKNLQINQPNVKQNIVADSEEKFIQSSKSLEFRKHYFPNTSEKEWNDWRWQLANAITSFERLNDFLSLTERESSICQGNQNVLPFKITPYYLSLLERDNIWQPLRKTVIPRLDEFIVSDGEASDPLFELHDSPCPNLVHRYPDRVLFLVTGFCSTYCRYCTRSHLVAKKDTCHYSMQHLEPAFKYIEEHTEIRDVLLSGGDPLTMPDATLEQILKRLHNIPHVEFIRIGTKVPVVLPQRITHRLCNMLKKYHPLWISIHFTHPQELSPETSLACSRLADAGIPLGSQTVLLKDVNDNVETMTRLVHGLLKIRVRPYYLYQCDPILGSAHFRTPVEKGLEIIHGLRGFTTGYAVPNYVIDAPGGGGKIPLLPEYFMGREGNNVILKNYEGKIFRYPDDCKTIETC